MTDSKDRFADFRPDRNFALPTEERSRLLPILFGVIALAAACGYGRLLFLC